MALIVKRCALAAGLSAARLGGHSLRAGHAAYFGRVVPLGGGHVSDRAAYQYLPKSVAYLPPQEELLGQLAGAGFPDARRLSLSVGIAQLLTGTRA